MNNKFVYNELRNHINVKYYSTYIYSSSKYPLRVPISVCMNYMLLYTE